jgi:hypothetical protein
MGCALLSRHLHGSKWILLFSGVHDFAVILRARKEQQIATMEGENQLELSQIRSYRIA